MGSSSYGSAMKRTIQNNRGLLPAILILSVLVTLPAGTFGQVVMETTEELSRIDVVEHLGDTLPMDLIFTNDRGETLPLGTYFNQGKPVLLVLGYYECPMLCNLVFNGISDGINELGWMPGDKYRMLTVSINPSESFELANAKKQNYLKAFPSDVPDSAWMFMVGPEDQSQALADAVGFKFFYDEKQDQYAHPAVAFVLTEKGVISRYLYGIEYRAKDLRLSLLEASDGKIGNTFDRLILYCFYYDPQAGGYVVFAGNVMRLSGAVALVVLAIFLGLLWRGESKRRKLHTKVIEQAVKH